jgi:hypothetical protein
MEHRTDGTAVAGHVAATRGDLGPTSVPAVTLTGRHHAMTELSVSSDNSVNAETQESLRLSTKGANMDSVITISEDTLTAALADAAPLAENTRLATLAADAAAFEAQGQKDYAVLLSMRDFAIQRLKGESTREWQETVAKVHPWIKSGGVKEHPTLGDFRGWFFKVSSVKGVYDKDEQKDAQNAWDWDLRQGRIALGLAEKKVKPVADPTVGDGETVPTGAASTGDPVLDFTTYLHKVFPGIIAGTPDKAACVSLSSAIGMLADSLDTYMAGRGYILDGTPEVIPVPVPVPTFASAILARMHPAVGGMVPVEPVPVPDQVTLDAMSAAAEAAVKVDATPVPVEPVPMTKTKARKMARAAKLLAKVAA